MNGITIDIPLPPKQTNQNARCHWAVKARATKAQREAAKWHAVAAAQKQLGGAPNWRSVNAHATFYLPRRMDPSNLAGWLKATWDGLQDAGIVANDSGLVPLPPAQVTGKETGGKRGVVLLITPNPRS